MVCTNAKNLVAIRYMCCDGILRQAVKGAPEVESNVDQRSLNQLVEDLKNCDVSYDNMRRMICS